MAEIVLGVASSHGPQLEMPPEHWRAYGDRGRTQAKHWYQGKTYSFPELVELRAEEHYERECTDDKFQTRWDACQQAIARLGDVVSAAAPDVCIILGDDQQEAFHDDNMPAFCLYHGETVDDAPVTSGHRQQWGDAIVANRPAERLTHPAEAALGEHLIAALTANEFDVTRSNKLPAGRGEGAIGHAFFYVYRRLMDNKVTPNVPIMVNTYYPPNSPTPSRCYRVWQGAPPGHRGVGQRQAGRGVRFRRPEPHGHRRGVGQPHHRWAPTRRCREAHRLPRCTLPGRDLGDQELDRPGRSDVRDWPSDGPHRLRPVLPHGGRERLRDGVRPLGVDPTAQPRLLHACYRSNP